MNKLLNIRPRRIRSQGKGFCGSRQTKSNVVDFIGFWFSSDDVRSDGINTSSQTWSGFASCLRSDFPIFVPTGLVGKSL